MPVAFLGSGEGTQLLLFGTPQSFVFVGGRGNKTWTNTCGVRHDGIPLSVGNRQTIVTGLGRDGGGTIGDSERSGIVDTQGRRDTGAHDRFLFLLEDICETEGDVEKGKVDGRVQIGTCTRRILPTWRQGCTDDSDIRNLPGLTMNWGDDYGNLAEEITSATCSSQT